jgi:hypothetical protein
MEKSELNFIFSLKVDEVCAVMASLIKMEGCDVTKYHKIFSSKGEFVAERIWQDDSNQGLPNWFFDGNFINFEVSPETDVVEWWPLMGPAPNWSEKYSKFTDNAAIFTAFSKWYRRTY